MSGLELAGCSQASTSRGLDEVLSILLMNRMRGTDNSSSSLRMTCSAGAFLSSASHTTTAASQPANAARASWVNSIEPGQSMKV
jgi:hypothetical protein